MKLYCITDTYEDTPHHSDKSQTPVVTKAIADDPVLTTGRNDVSVIKGVSKNILHFLLSAFWMIAFFGSCTELIELKTANSEPVVVIYGCLTENTVHQTVYIAMSSPYFVAEPNKPVSDAIVSIQTSDDQTFELEETNEKGLYRTKYPMAAIAGITYHLTVSVDPNQSGNLKHFEATTTMQRPFLVDSINIEVRYLMGYKYYSLNLYAQEEEGPDFYCAYTIINDSLYTSYISSYTVFSDYGIDGRYIDGLPVIQLEDYENERFSDTNTYYHFVKPDDKVTCCISLIEKGYYDFLQQCQSERRGENPFFGGPASNIATNISNGGVGYFTAFSTTRIDTYVP